MSFPNCTLNVDRGEDYKVISPQGVLYNRRLLEIGRHYLPAYWESATIMQAAAANESVTSKCRCSTSSAGATLLSSTSSA